MPIEKKIKVSIIMPVYNAESYLRDSIGDILAQSFRDFELICVNDGSTDDSGLILQEFASRDDRVYIINQENLGGGAARNNGMQHAKGKYLLFLDADDRFESELLLRSIDKAENENSCIVVFNADVFDNETGVIGNAPWLLKENSYRQGDSVFSAFNMTVWNKLFRREFIESYGFRFTERKAGYSTSFVALSLSYADKISMIKDILVHYRINNPNSNLANEDNDPTAIFDALMEIRNRLLGDGKLDNIHRAFVGLCEESLIERLNAMRTSKGYLELYQRIHDKGLVLLSESDGKINMEALGRLKSIIEKEAADFLYDQRMNLRRNSITGIEAFVLPQSLKEKGFCNIALYGGGDMGICFFDQIKRKGIFTLVGWVDRNFEKIGWPLQSPEVLKDLNFDVVLIAVADKRTAESIKTLVLGEGVPEDKILWDPPIRI